MLIVSALPVVILISTLIITAVYRANRQIKPLSKENILFITAHPDDECMFFSPAILGMQGSNLFLVCLSIGDAEGLGKVRSKELLASCNRLGIPPRNVFQINSCMLPDSMSAEWDAREILGIVLPLLKSKRIDRIVTFDAYGVSGHANHRAIYQAIKSGVDQGNISIPVYVLISVSLLRKFTSVFDILFTDLTHRSDLTFVASPHHYQVGRNAMFEHSSQLVWFRYLYLLFSRYMVINNLQLVENRSGPRD